MNVLTTAPATSRDAPVDGRVQPFDARVMAAGVDADMAATFERWSMGGPEAGTRGSRSRPVFGSGAAARRNPPRRAEVVVAVTVGLLVGVAVGAVITRRPSAPLPALGVATADSASSASRVGIPPFVRAAPSPAAPLWSNSRSAGVAAGPVATDLLQRPRYRPAASAQTRVMGPAYAPSRTAPYEGVARPGRPKALRPAAIASRPAAATPLPAWGRGEGDAGRTVCGAGAPDRQYACLVQASSQADAELRDSYRLAIRKGVPYSTLERYRSAWMALRSDGTDDPERMIVGYRRLAAELGREAGSPGRRWSEDWPDDPPGDPE